MPTVQLVCDRCRTGRQALPGQSTAMLRSELIKVGWKCDSNRNRDLCPRCR